MELVYEILKKRNILKWFSLFYLWLVLQVSSFCLEVQLQDVFFYWFNFCDIDFDLISLWFKLRIGVDEDLYVIF